MGIEAVPNLPGRLFPRPRYSMLMHNSNSRPGPDKLERQRIRDQLELERASGRTGPKVGFQSALDFALEQAKVDSPLATPRQSIVEHQIRGRLLRAACICINRHCPWPGHHLEGESGKSRKNVLTSPTRIQAVNVKLCLFPTHQYPVRRLHQ